MFHFYFNRGYCFCCIFRKYLKYFLRCHLNHLKVVFYMMARVHSYVYENLAGLVSGGMNIIAEDLYRSLLVVSGRVNIIAEDLYRSLLVVSGGENIIAEDLYRSLLVVSGGVNIIAEDLYRSLLVVSGGENIIAKKLLY